MATERRQQIIDWLRDSGNPRAEELLNSLAQMNTDEWEQKHRRDLRKIMGYVDIEKNVLPLRDRARGEFDTYVDNPEWYIKGKAAKLGVNIEDLKKTLAELEEERIWNEGRARRAKEVNERFVWNFAPKSSQQRYIDDPNATIFGKEGKYNPYSTEGARDMRDVALGGIGLVGDFLPGFNAWVGPAARAARNAALIEEGSPYAPSLADAGKELANDAVTFGAAAWLQNFRQAKRMAGGAEKSIPGLEKISKNAKTTAEIDNTYNGISNVMNAKNYDEAVKAVSEMPENEIKNALLEKINSFNMIGDPNAEAKFVLDLAKTAESKGTNLSMVLNHTDKGYEVVEPKEVAKNFAKAYDNQGLVGTILADDALKETANIRKTVRATPKIGKTGQIVRDVFLPAYGGLEQGLAKNATTLYKASPEDKDRAQVDWYKQNYARDWEMGFVPKGKDNEPIMRAYNEWLAENQQNPTIKNIFGN
jgi:hypothetical protein